MYTLRIITRDSKLIVRKKTAKIKVGASVKRGLKGEQGPQGEPGTTDYNALINKPDLTLKADKVTTVNTLYGVNGLGNQYSYPISQAANTSSIAQRSSGGTLAVGTPTSGAHATTKTYVDSQDTSVAFTAQSNLTAHTSNTANPHNVTKAQVGLSDVPNLDTTAAVANQHTHANKAVLDATTASFTTADEMKLDGIATGAQVNTVTSVAGKTGVVALAKGDVGLANADNTSDMDKPVSTATQTALNGKVSTTGNQTIAGTKTFSSALITQSGTSIGGVLHLTGVGFPNGVVSAPIGSVYIDTAVTNGASSWIKKSGTGNTGWQVLEGDTGWRQGMLINGWVGTFRLRRVGSTVAIQMDYVRSGTDVVMATLPTGFSPVGRLKFAATVGGTTQMIFVSTGGVVEKANIAHTGPTGGGEELTYFTTNPWPTTLPGTAA